MIQINYYFLELRLRFFYCVLSIFFCFSLVYKFFYEFYYLLILWTIGGVGPLLGKPCEPMIDWLDQGVVGRLQEISHVMAIESKRLGISTKPMAEFIFTDIVEAFQTSLSISFTISFFIGIPLILYNIWSFLAPSFYKSEKKEFSRDCIFFLIFFLVATFISICFVFPFFWNFFLSFEQNGHFAQLESQPKISSYLSFFYSILFFTHFFSALIFIFHLLLKYDILILEKITKKRPHIYMTFLVLSALFSPPEVLIQMVLFFLSIFFFEISLFIKIMSKSIHNINNCSCTV